MDRAAGADHHPDRLLHRPEAARQHPGRPRRAAGRHRDRLDRRLHAPGRRHRRRARTSRSACRRFNFGRLGHGLSEVSPLLATAIPLGIYNFTEGMSNVESAAAAGDNYNLRSILLADGTGAVVGSVLGSPFPPAVYIGHPGWKAAGGRTGYSMGSGVVIALFCFLRPVRAARRHPAEPGDRADPALHRPADRRAGVPGGAASGTRSPSSSRSSRTSPPGRRARSTTRWPRPAPRRPRSATPTSPPTAPSTRARCCSAAARSWPAWCSARSPRSSSTASSSGPPGTAAAGAVLGFIGLVHGAKVGWDIGGADRARLPVRGGHPRGVRAAATGRRRPNCSAPRRSARSTEAGRRDSRGESPPGPPRHPSAAATARRRRPRLGRCRCHGRRSAAEAVCRHDRVHEHARLRPGSGRALRLAVRRVVRRRAHGA